MEQFKNSIVDLRVSKESRSNSICKVDSNFQSVLKSSPPSLSPKDRVNEEESGVK